jgi:HlyD family secretion protein
MSSPEQIDQLISIFKPKSWISLMTLSGIVLFVVLWSIFGSIPTTVSGSGILLKQGGIFDVESLGSGIVKDVYVSLGDSIEKGDIIAEISQPSLEQDIKQSEDMLTSLLDRKQEMESFYDSSRDLEIKSLDKEKDQLERSIESELEKIFWLKDKVEAQNKAYDLGIITKDALQNSVQSLAVAESNLSKLQINIESLKLKQLSSQMREDRDLTDLEQTVISKEKQIESLKLQLNQSSIIISPYSGTVQEIKIRSGELINFGIPVISLEKSDTKLMVTGFIAGVGQQVQPGMKVQISPATVKKEEFGYLIGDVMTISGLPTTRQGIMKLLNNDLLVEQLASKGAPFTIEIELIKNSDTVSGYKWSSDEGPPINIESGTMCELRVVVREQRPITLALPILKKTFGLM